MLLTTAVMCMALNVYHESRGESISGQFDVARVTMNRAKEPDKVCKVVKAKKQFSWTTKLVVNERLTKRGEPKDKAAWIKANVISVVALFGPNVDLTNGATHYHTKSVKPKWRKSMLQTKVNGRHIFYKLNKSQLT